MVPVLLPPGCPAWFPDPRGADADGLVALGADLDLERVLLAYRMGIFPWYGDDLPPMWWSPDPRAVIPVDGVHVARRLRRRLRQGRFRLTWNRAFEEVMRACATERHDGTWIVPEMIAAYVRLHRAGHAHSLEVWDADGALVGGIYGVQRGGLFAAESMFHRRTDASKIALVACVRTVAAAGVGLFDVQLPTDHLASMGAVKMSRFGYLTRLATVVDRQIDLRAVTPRWRPA